MLYPAFVELGDKHHAYSVVLPDFKGCFTAVDTEKDLQKAVQEAVELFCEGENLTLPKPSHLADLKNHPDFDYDGVWMLFDIDTVRLSTRSRRVNVTFPEYVLARLDGKAKAEHLSRSALLQKLVLDITE